MTIDDLDFEAFAKSLPSLIAPADMDALLEFNLRLLEIPSKEASRVLEVLETLELFEKVRLPTEDILEVSACNINHEIVYYVNHTKKD